MEADAHPLKQLFASRESDGILLVDASNAFINLNRMNALANIRSLYPPLSTVLYNSYQKSLLGSNILLSQEGTTQGDPLAILFFALATRLLIDTLSCHIPEVWYADDASATGKLSDLLAWRDKLSTLGPSFGYYAKTWLIVSNTWPGK